MLYHALRFIGIRLFALYFRLQAEGKEHIPQEGAYLIVANHTSFLDPFFICAIIPRVIHFFTLSLFYDHSLLHWLCKRLYCIPIKKGGTDISAMKKALRLLNDGELIGIFPEGTRSWTGELGEGEAGVSLLALKAHVPIVPVYIQGAYESFPRRALFPKPYSITVTFGKPFRLEEFINFTDCKNSELRQEATDMIMSRIADSSEPLKFTEEDLKG